MKVNNFLTLAIVSLSLSLAACQSSKTDPTSDYKSLENSIPPGTKPVLRQDGVNQLYVIKPSSAFAFQAGESRSIKFQIAMIKGINYTVRASDLPEGMTLKATSVAGEYEVTWNPTNQILSSTGNKGHFNIHVIPNKNSDPAVLKQWIDSNYIEVQEFQWTATKSTGAVKPAANVKPEPTKPTPPAKLGQIANVTKMEATFKADAENVTFFTVKGDNGVIAVDMETLNRVDFSALPGAPQIKECKDVANQTFVKECKVYWKAPCEVKDEYKFKIPVTNTLDKQVNKKSLDYVIKFEKNTNTCKAAVKPASTTEVKK